MKIEVRESAIQGLGIFASVYISAGETIHVVAYDIAAGTEITVDYLINNPGGTSWPCHCGAARCRGMTGTSFFALPIELRREYVPLLASWFREKFAERLGDT